MLGTWRLWLLGGLVAALLAVGVAANGWRKEVAAQRARAVAAERALVETARARLDDQKAAQGNYEDLARTCTADFAEAIKRGRTIERIIQAPAPIAGAPRGIVTADELRDVVGGRAAADSR